MKAFFKLSDHAYRALLATVALVACDDDSATKPQSQAGAPLAVEVGDPPVANPPAALVPPPGAAEQADAGAAAPPPPWEGPFFVVTRSSTGVYKEPTIRREVKIGYLQEGAQVGVHAEPLAKSNCSGGWYRVVTGGFVCGSHGTVDPNDEKAKHRPKQPDLDAVLPYTYARNAHNGTPLYRSVPSKDQVRLYEPYRFESETPKPAPKPAVEPVKVELDEATLKAREDQRRRMEALRSARRAMLGEEAAKKLEAEEALAEAQKQPAAANPSPASEVDAGAQKEWWQREDVALNEIKLEDLDAAGDDVLAKRMVKGFYIAVERQFNWDNRRWYRSTSGAIAPADRFHATSGSDFKGVELDDKWQLPIAWAYGWKDKKPRYELDPDSGKPRPKGSIERFDAINLTGEEMQVGKTTYLESADGFWVRSKDVRVTKPGPPPTDVAADERWIDINLATQTIVLFRGTKPVYATLISSGKESTIKEKDHRTPLGEFRVREKHITSTMDGDGTAAGDLPYSIEAVPYVMFFHKAYAVHGAFWHRNYGVRMSHGCVNLAPLDAKYLFFNSDPPVPEGWHGAWSSEDRLGSRVVVHE